jgi:predicted regulator of Ras-like GTPase activity (Roadblock/LC7/MglB family)
LKKGTKTEVVTELTSETAVISVGDNESYFSSLSNRLAEIRKLRGVIGYILRSETSAVIDLSEQEKVIAYAILSSQISESSFEITKQFNLTNIETILVEGKSVKVLCLNKDENKISIFMETTTDHSSIIKRMFL